MSATIRDIAKVAGVSVASVSKVLHGGGGTIRVSAEKAEYIKSIAREMQYVPNVVARTLRSGRSNTIGLVFEQFGSISAGPLYYVYLLDAIASVLFERHYRLTILPEIDSEKPESLSDGRLDGLIWCKLDRNGGIVNLIERDSLPVVALNSSTLGADTRLINFHCDNEGGIRLILDHLVELGHTKILFVMETGEVSTPDAVVRRDAFYRIAKEKGLHLGEEDVVQWSRTAIEFPAWWALQTGHTALVAWNEGVAGSILQVARRNGVKVPTDLSVVGFDSTAYCDTTTPRLTAARQPIREMAIAAATTLVDLVEGRAPTHLRRVFPCTLDVRGSTSEPRKQS